LPREQGFLALFCFSIFYIFSSPVVACALAKGESVAIAGAGEDGVLTLSDGRSVKLVGIDMPEPRASLPGDLPGKTVFLQYGGTRIDRYGRALALVMFADGSSLQERLIADGAARVAPSGDMRLCMADLLAAEARARSSRRGLWRDPAFAVRQADDVAALDRLEGSYQLVEGVVKSVAKIRGRLYFNFSDDWRSDFTVTVGADDAKLFAVGGWGKLTSKEPLLVGAKVRVRGVLSRYNGPGITVAVPEQIELLDRAMPEESKKAADERGRKTSAKKPRRKPDDAAR
jgi:endonuclease YncB( thermonuclease family)